MPDQPPPSPPSAAAVQARLQELARLLRTADHLDPDAQQALADLVDELGEDLNPSALPSGETAHLLDSVAQLAQAIHQQEDRGVLAAATEQLRRAAVRLDAEAPLTAGVLRRLIDALANLGI